MKSPFPGMDPYLEQYWPEVHASLIVYARNQLNRQLPDGLRAGVEQTLTVQSEDESISHIRPDVHVGETPTVGFQADSRNVAVAEPIKIQFPTWAQRHIEIQDLEGRIVTAIEFLSPANKVGEQARTKYFQKQMKYLHSHTNLVEVDLVRQGKHLLAIPESEIPDEHRTPYMIFVYRYVEPDCVSVFRAPLQERLPNIPIPLRAHDADVVLELQPLIDDCYRDGRYRIDYVKAPAPPLPADDDKWADALLRERGCR